MARVKQMTSAQILAEVRKLQARRRPKDPPFNESVEAVALRQAAIEFAKGLTEPTVDDFDTRGRRRNTALLFAAIEYADLVSRQGRP